MSRRSRISRAPRTAARIAVLTLTASALATGPAIAAGTTAGATAGTDGGAKPTVVLVHGAFADASGWSGVVERLQHHGYKVVAPANPLRSLSGDSTYIASVLKSIEGPIVLAGHSYGGAVITEAAAGNPNVKALVYVSAFMPDKGETLGALSAKFTGSELQPALKPVPYTDGTTTGQDLYIRDDKFHSVFGADLARAETKVMAVEQRPIAAACFEEKATKAAWRSIPSWFVVSKHDKAIAPDLERFEARRAKSHTVELNSSHVSMMSHPDVVTRLIREAATATAGDRRAELARTGAQAQALVGVGGLAGAALLAGTALVMTGRRHSRD
ncbi:alpha/beta fold hydrolase [Streptomyces yaizuensis]|uniref:Alpha/beta hydrolase n=1 Tax=Streptomyces yaizuensis TaxID=2989713 RepID=A0ABQ5P091_9ACTN|nr:alpha/beta hydrolase [Streptomyces sp. YSPA8]GLF95858.1 alpha/beta hydrolase [Streptomyces sp. YSPA8]